MRPAEIRGAGRNLWGLLSFMVGCNLWGLLLSMGQGRNYGAC